MVELTNYLVETTALSSKPKILLNSVVLKRLRYSRLGIAERFRLQWMFVRAERLTGARIRSGAGRLAK